MAILIDAGNNTQAKRLIRVRDLCEGITSAGMSDDDIVDKLDKSDRWLEVQTNKFDWKSTDERWGLALDASEHRCASEIMHGVPERDRKAGTLISAAREIIKGINFKDAEIQKNDMPHVAKGPDLETELDPDEYLGDMNDL